MKVTVVRKMVTCESVHIRTDIQQQSDAFHLTIEGGEVQGSYFTVPIGIHRVRQVSTERG